MPHALKPMLASLANQSFDGEGWVFEIKFDGYRTIGEIKNSNVEIYSRNNISFNSRFGSIVRSLKEIKTNAILDGELVVLDKDGVSRFQLLQNYNQRQEGNLTYFVFDLLYLKEYDLRDLPLIERKNLLKEIIPAASNIKYSDHIEEKGRSFFSLCKKKGLEGIIAKKANSIYYSGQRSKEWLKIKTHKRQEAVIAGFTRGRGGRKYFGALVLGVYENGRFIYIGHTGGGFTEKSLAEVTHKLLPLIQQKSPFHEVPKTNMPVQWIKPELVCEVEFQEWTEDGHMRVPIFMGLREDKLAREVKRENPIPAIKTDGK